MDHDGGDSRSLMSARLHSSMSKGAAVFFIQLICLHLYQASYISYRQLKMFKKYNRRIYYKSGIGVPSLKWEN